MSLPITRLRDAGAHETEIAHLEADHDRLTPDEQANRETFFASKALEDIREWLKGIRHSGYFKAPEPVELPEKAEEGTAVTEEQKAEETHDGDKPATRAKK
ncbi:MAG TPA: hypothetical protein VGN13_12450 [Solirubrobacteraceae bacterium]|jgi:hypothetical protein